MALSVSVVLTVYDRYDHLPQAIESVRNQTLTDGVELIVVDDGSPRDVRTMLEDRFPGIRWLRQDNRGVCAARRLGSENARADYLVYLDDDDLWLPERLATQVRFLEAHPEADLVCCDMTRFTAEGDTGRFYDQFLVPLRRTPHRELAADPPEFLFAPGALLGQFLTCDPFGIASVMVRKGFLAQMGGWDPSIRGNGDCHDFFLRASHRGTIGYQHRALVKYRRHHGRHMTQGYYEPRFEECRVLCRVQAGYPAALRKRIRPHLAGYLARCGKEFFAIRRLDLAAPTLYRAVRCRQLRPEILARWLIATSLVRLGIRRDGDIPTWMRRLAVSRRSGRRASRDPASCAASRPRTRAS